MTGPDRDLRERFDSMRRAEAARVTNFERVLESAKIRRLRPRLSLAAIALAAASLAALGLAISQLRQPSSSHETLAEWTAPTDFLLRTPGSELLSSAPAFAPPQLERSLPR